MNHQKRRQTLLNQLENNAVVIISTNPAQLRSGDVYFPFRANSDFYYLTGFQEPEAVAVFSRKHYAIFLRPREETREVWEGRCLGVEDAPKGLQADKAYPINQLSEQLRQLVTENTPVYFDPKICQSDKAIADILSVHQIQSAAPLLHEMRLIKDSDEIQYMQKSADIAAQAHTLAMQTVKAGMFEYEVQSVFSGYFAKHCVQNAYMPIIAGGKNACILHYTDNNKILRRGDLLLIDAGCEVACYASDITRTFPVSGKFSTAQRQIYQIVLDAQRAAIGCIKPGVKINQPHEIAKKIITKGLQDLGILTDAKSLKNFFMHRTGHWLGLDVHDVGEYKQQQEYRTFVAGMITTVEPGIYIRRDDKINPIYHNIGVRIEDDILVTEIGHKTLTSAAARNIDDIESIMKEII